MLFRSEALRHSQRDHSEGELLVRDRGVLLACVSTAVAAACAIAVLLFATRYTPQVRVDGRLLDDGSAQFLAPAAALPRIVRGQRIALRYLQPLAPGAKPVYGTVQAVASAPGAGSGSGFGYRLSVTPPADAPRAPPGTVVQASLALADMRLIDWIVRGRQ